MGWAARATRSFLGLKGKKGQIQNPTAQQQHEQFEQQQLQRLAEMQLMLNDLTLAQRLETDPQSPRITRIKLQANWIYFESTEKNPVPGRCHAVKIFQKHLHVTQNHSSYISQQELCSYSASPSADQDGVTIRYHLRARFD